MPGIGTSFSAAPAPRFWQPVAAEQLLIAKAMQAADALAKEAWPQRGADTFTFFDVPIFLEGIKELHSFTLGPESSASLSPGIDGSRKRGVRWWMTLLSCSAQSKPALHPSSLCLIDCDLACGRYLST